MVVQCQRLPRGGTPEAVRWAAIVKPGRVGAGKGRLCVVLRCNTGQCPLTLRPGLESRLVSSIAPDRSRCKRLLATRG